MSLLFDAEGIDEHLYLPYEKYKSKRQMRNFMAESITLTPPPAEIRDLMEAFENNGYGAYICSVKTCVPDAIPVRRPSLAVERAGVSVD